MSIHCIFQNAFVKAGKKHFKKRLTIPLEDFPRNLNRAFGQQLECYQSIHCLNKNKIEYAYLVIDLDSENLTAAKDTAQKIVQYLLKNVDDSAVKVFLVDRRDSISTLTPRYLSEQKVRVRITLDQRFKRQ